MSEQVKIYPEKIHLLSVRVIKGNIDVGDDFEEGQLASFNIEFDSKEGFGLDDKLVRIVFTTRITAVNEENGVLPLTAEFSLEFIFKIDNLTDYISRFDEEIKNINVHYALGHTLLGIVYSTARGIILTRTQGTVVQEGILLPVIDTSILLKKTEEEQ